MGSRWGPKGIIVELCAFFFRKAYFPHKSRCQMAHLPWRWSLLLKENAPTSLLCIYHFSHIWVFVELAFLFNTFDMLSFQLIR